MNDHHLVVTSDLLKIHDELVGKMRSLQGDDHSCDCGHDHN